MGYMNSDEPYGTRLYYKEELEKLQKEFESMERQKNHWWRKALHYHQALRQISERINKESQSEKWTSTDAAIMHEIAEKALIYAPPND